MRCPAQCPKTGIWLPQANGLPDYAVVQRIALFVALRVAARALLLVVLPRLSTREIM
ncbi:hypothetical protein Tco_1564722, partial [Tanacetum coccineum]